MAGEELCQECGARVASIKMKIHMRVNHDKEEKKCKDCNLVCVGKKSFYNHMRNQGKNFKDTNGEFGETLHSTLKNFEARKGFTITRKIGDDRAVITGHQSISTINALHMGSFRAQDMTLRSPASSPRSPASSPGWNQAKRFKKKQLESVKSY